VAGEAANTVEPQQAPEKPRECAENPLKNTTGHPQDKPGKKLLQIFVAAL
jgi:hypothetical protein